MRLLAFFIVAISLQQEVQFKPNEDFDATLEYQFKPYKDAAHKEGDYSAQRIAPSGSLLYLVVRVKLKKLDLDEVRVTVASNLENSMVNKKAVQDMILKIDFGFIEDVKDRITAHEYTILLTSRDKKEISRIYLFIDKDGTFLVNGQKRGKF